MSNLNNSGKNSSGVLKPVPNSFGKSTNGPVSADVISFPVDRNSNDHRPAGFFPEPSTNLAYLIDSVDEAVAAQIENPLAPMDVAKSAIQQATYNIAGITVTNPEIIESHKESRYQALRDYQESASTLKNFLEQNGVSYLTIWPTKAWETLRREAQLFKFSPDKNGRVAIDLKAAFALLNRVSSNLNTEISRRKFKVIFRSFIVVFSIVFFLISAFFSPGFLALIGGTVCGIISISVSSFFVDDYFTDRTGRETFEAQLIRNSIGKTPHEIALSLWPDLTEAEHTKIHFNRNLFISIALPPAPPDIQTNLLKAQKANLHLYVNVVGDAITFFEDPVDLLIKERKLMTERKRREELRRQEELRRMASSSRDPIVTTEYKNATAIIAQYGDFPIEKDLIRHVLNSSALI